MKHRIPATVHFHPGNLLMAMLLLITLLIASCEPEIVTKIKLPEEDPKLSVSAHLITSNQEHILFVGKSKPHNKPTDEFWNVNNAVVKISNGIKTVILQNLGEGKYSFQNADLPVVSGENYSLSVYAPGFVKEATATCTLPDDFDPMLQLTSLDSVKETDYTNYMVNLKLKDQAGTADQYRIMGKIFFLSEDTGDTTELILYAPQGKFSLFSDEGKDGQWLTSRMQYSMYSWEKEFFGKPLAVEITLLHTDRPYYLFHYPFVVKDYYPEENPFAEPVIIYSNIVNGYGIFCGAVSKTYRINL